MTDRADEPRRRPAAAPPGSAEPRVLHEVVLATSNRGKLRDFELLFAGSGIELLLAADVGIDLDVEETGSTFVENALLKAHAVGAASGRPTLADDSGLEVYALGGEPGIYSARYAGPQCDDHANNLKLIEKLRGVTDRRAAFVCALVLVSRGEPDIIVQGRCEGTVTHEERGRNGFGYDAVFYREDLGRTFGEASPAEKNSCSHRAAAVHALLDELGRRRLAPSA